MDAVKLDELKQRAAKATEIAAQIEKLSATTKRAPSAWVFAGEEVLTQAEMGKIIWIGRQQWIELLEKELSQLLGERVLTPGEDEDEEPK